MRTFLQHSFTDSRQILNAPAIPRDRKRKQRQKKKAELGVLSPGESLLPPMPCPPVAASASPSSPSPTVLVPSPACHLAELSLPLLHSAPLRGCVTTGPSRLTCPLGSGPSVAGHRTHGEMKTKGSRRFLGDKSSRELDRKHIQCPAPWGYHPQIL